MKLEHVLALAVRIFAIALIIQALKTAVNLIVFLKTSDSSFTSVAYFGTVVSLVLLAVILWKFPVLIARKIANFPTLDEAEISSVDSEKFLQTGLTILGIYFLYYVITDLFYWGYFLIASSRDPANPIELTLEHKSLIFSTFVELVIALFLIFGTKRVIQIINHLRYGGS